MSYRDHSPTGVGVGQAGRGISKPAPAVVSRRTLLPGSGGEAPVVAASRIGTGPKPRPSRTSIETWESRAQAAPGARRRVETSAFAPQLCSSRKTAPLGDGWLHEIKWDGYRLLAGMVGGKVMLRSRNGLDWTERFPRIVAALTATGLDTLRLDGELVALDAQGRSDFNALQQALKTGQVDQLRYLVFDMPRLAGVDLAQVPLLARKGLLEALLAGSRSSALAYSRHIIGHGDRVFAKSARQGVEGIISKRVDAAYRPGRSADWVKVKHEDTDEFLVVGYTLPKGARSNFGSLLLARPEGGRLVYVGRVGSGYDAAALKDILSRLSTIPRSDPAAPLPPHVKLAERDVRWVQPRLVAEVAFRGWGKDRLLRQAAFKRLRDDKSAEELQPEAPVTVHITHPERTVYASAGISKGEVADYYRRIAPWMLTELANRPLSLVRCPGGADASCFFQKHHADAFGSAVRSIPLEQKSGVENYLYVENADGLLALVQFNALEFHPWGARVDAPEQPDRIIFDLDPDEGIGWKLIVAAARDVRSRLSAAGLESFVRVTGGKGVHVVAPIRRGPTWDDARAYCEAMANAMAEQEPDRYVATMSKSKRTGRIFIDWLRNTRGATSVTSWSLRARPGAPVAMPVRWEELGRLRSANGFDLRKALRRAATLKTDPWGEMEALDQPLPPA